MKNLFCFYNKKKKFMLVFSLAETAILDSPLVT